MTSQCAQWTSKTHTIKKTGILTIVILCRYNNRNIGAETRIRQIRQPSPFLRHSEDSLVDEVFPNVSFLTMQKPSKLELKNSKR